MPKRFPRFKAGDQFGLRGRNGELILDKKAADLLNAAAEEMRRLGKVSVTPPLRWTETADGRKFACDFNPEIMVKLSGAGPQYSFVQQQYDPPTHTWSDMPGGRTGTNCYESKGKTGLAGKIVQIVYVPTANDWRFSYVGYGGCPSNFLTFTLQQCGTNTCPIVGATVNFILGGSTVHTGTTNSSGQVTFSGGVNPGTYDISWSLASPSLSGSFTGVFVVTGACESLSAIKHMATPPGAPPYACSFCGPAPVPQLYVTDSQGTRPTNVCTVGTGGSTLRSLIFVTSSNCAGTGTTITVSTSNYGLTDPTCSGGGGGALTGTASVSCVRPFTASGTYSFGGGPFSVHE